MKTEHFSADQAIQQSYMTHGGTMSICFNGFQMNESDSGRGTTLALDTCYCIVAVVIRVQSSFSHPHAERFSAF